jgi:hypothetical protein
LQEFFYVIIYNDNRKVHFNTPKQCPSSSASSSLSSSLRLGFGWQARARNFVFETLCTLPYALCS